MGQRKRSTTANVLLALGGILAVWILIALAMNLSNGNFGGHGGNSDSYNAGFQAGQSGAARSIYESGYGAAAACRSDFMGTRVDHEMDSNRPKWDQRDYMQGCEDGLKGK